MIIARRGRHRLSAHLFIIPFATTAGLRLPLVPAVSA